MYGPIGCLGQRQAKRASEGRDYYRAALPLDHPSQGCGLVDYTSLCKQDLHLCQAQVKIITSIYIYHTQQTLEQHLETEIFIRYLSMIFTVKVLYAHVRAHP